MPWFVDLARYWIITNNEGERARNQLNFDLQDHDHSDSINYFTFNKPN